MHSRTGPVTFKIYYFFRPQHCLYFLPLPQGQGSFGYTLSAARCTGFLALLSSLFVPVT